MILIDTSAWIQFFRGSGLMAERVDEAIESDEAAWCGPIATELGRGLSSKNERDRVLGLLGACHWLEQPARLWEDAGELGFVLGRGRKTLKTLDLLIATYALDHDCALLTADADFRHMQQHGIPLRLINAAR